MWQESKTTRIFYEEKKKNYHQKSRAGIQEILLALKKKRKNTEFWREILYTKEVGQRGKNEPAFKRRRKRCFLPGLKKKTVESWKRKTLRCFSSPIAFFFPALVLFFFFFDLLFPFLFFSLISLLPPFRHCSSFPYECRGCRGAIFPERCGLKVWRMPFFFLPPFCFFLGSKETFGWLSKRRRTNKG